MKINNLRGITVYSAFIAMLLFISGCTVNVNPPEANNSQPTPLPNNTAPIEARSDSRWSVAVCSSRAKNLTLSAGLSENDGEIFAVIQENSEKRLYDLPARVQSSSRIYFKGSSSDKSQVEMCVLYDGRSAKRVEFDDDEDVMINSSDTDSSDQCRCTE